MVNRLFHQNPTSRRLKNRFSDSRSGLDPKTPVPSFSFLTEGARSQHGADNCS